ncbi:MAG: recombinase family protein [bacterium]|nr:recombinase family protein [bacterium]
MKKAIIYIRVSTDEQADKGYSLKHQDEYLRKYCEIQSIQVVDIFQEDYSAKTFVRPAFNQLLKKLKDKKLKANLLIFTKWDRFSRNAPDAYAMIKTLHSFGVEPQAIEQPLDIGVPENKIMLAFYLAAPEVENDRRALNVIVGMRRAKKEGRWMSTAPRGYDNKTDEFGRKYIAPNNIAPIIKWAFETLATGCHSVEDIRRQCKNQGFDFKKSCFYKIFRNPAYYGKILIPAYKNEELQLVPGKHKPLISEELFQRVQVALDPKRFKHSYFVRIREEIPLRGFLNCPQCDKKLTGSRSTGGSGIKHYYYHCSKGCKERIKAHELNTVFADHLNTLNFRNDIKAIYHEILVQNFKQRESKKSTNSQILQIKIKTLADRLIRAQQMMLDGNLEINDYKEIKNTLELQSEELKKSQSEIEEQELDYRRYFRKEFNALTKLGAVFINSDVNQQQQLVRLLIAHNMKYSKGKMVSVALKPFILKMII